MDSLFQPDASDPRIQAFEDYKEMRRTIKKKMTARAEELAWKRLETLAPGDPEKQIKILEESTFNSWQGLFPLRTMIAVSVFSREVESRAFQYFKETGKLATEELKIKWEAKLKAGERIY